MLAMPQDMEDVRMKECSRCLVKETADAVVIGEDGACSVCIQVEKKFDGTIDWTRRQREWDLLCADAKLRAQNTGANYDCIVPFSGGKDSTYQLWYICTQTTLKPLVVQFDHWGMRPNLLENNTRTFRKLGVDVISFKPNWRVVRELMIEALKRRGDSCWHCHTGVYSYPMHVSLQYRVPLIIWGESLSEYQSFGLGELEEVNEERFNRAMNQGMTADDMVAFLGGRVSKRDLWPYAYPKRGALQELGLRSVCLGDYRPWNTRAQVGVIKRELGWNGDVVEGVPPGFDYEKIECFMQGTRDYAKYLKRGFGRTNHVANIAIRHGHMTREEGDALQKEYDGKRPHSLTRFLELLDMSEDEFHDIMLQHEVDPWTSAGKNYETGPALPDIEQWR